MNKTIYSFLSGILIGTCMILPGVSGSIIAIMLGIYDEVIYLLNSKYNNLKKIKKILPLAIGVLIGIFIFGKILLIFYNKYTYYMMYIFIGLISGSIPVLVREIKEKNEKLNIKYIIVSFLISVLMIILSKCFDSKLEISNKNFIKLFLGGFLYISGKIIPGISSSFFLMMLGLYDYILTILTNPFSINFNTIVSLIPFILGILIGLYIFIKIINYLLNNQFSKTYSSIIGFIIGSIIVIFPGIKLNSKCMISFILMILSYLLVNKLSKK